ncbi:MAG: glycosyl transferase group 1 [Planctomycetes bacterium]|jgi:glycosyltransferase involved in cell wall biosynthesis|nr:glycosyl transferase group 1 [Planctomycetota bacterium]
MRIVQLTPGTGSFYCGSCFRDIALAKGLKSRGHDVVVAPLYLPFMLEEYEEERPVLLGGINVYLQHKLPFLRHLPRFLQDWMDAPSLLRLASRRASMTKASELGEMTVSMLRGEEGRQVHELEKLVAWLRGIGAPDALLLSNAMLVGLARRLRAALGVPIYCTLQGEAPFLDALPAQHSRIAWETLGERAREIDAFLAVSRFTADLMSERLGLLAERVHVVPNGIDVEGATAPAPVSSSSSGPPTIGFLARLCADKGIDTLVEAFLQLKRRPGMEAVKLEAVGARLKEDRGLLRTLREKLERAGCRRDVRFRANVTREQKLEFLGRIDVLSVPATYGESFGLYLLEAWANGIPVVQPRHAAFPELIEATGGGLLCEPDDPGLLADGLEELLSNPARARELGAAGRAAVASDFTADRMARDVERFCTPGA